MIFLFSFVGRINHIIDSGMVDHPLIFSLAKNIQLGLRPRRIFLVSSEYQRIIDHPLIDYLINIIIITKKVVRCYIVLSVPIIFQVSAIKIWIIRVDDCFWRIANVTAIHHLNRPYISQTRVYSCRPIRIWQIPYDTVSA